MRSIVGFFLGLAFALAITSAHSSTTNSGALTVTPDHCDVNMVTKDMICRLQYSVTTSGYKLNDRQLRIPGNNGAIIDDASPQIQIAATVPTAISTGRDSFISGFTTTVQSGAAGGALDE